MCAPKATLVKSKTESEIKGQIIKSLVENEEISGDQIQKDQYQCESHCGKNQLIPNTILQHNSATIPELLPSDQFFIQPPQFWNSLPPNQPITHEPITVVPEELDSYQPYAWYVETV